MTEQQRKALKLALEALEADPLEMVADADGHMVFLKDQVITDIKEALAQPEQEPVEVSELKRLADAIELRVETRAERMIIADKLRKLAYTIPPQPKEPEQEPLAYFNPQVKGGFYWAKPTKITAPVTVSVEPIPLYTTPPQRKPLTLVELSHIFASIPSVPFDGEWQLELARTIEAAHGIKEKNT